MNEFKTILTKLKEIIKQQLQTDTKVLDKDVAQVLSITPALFASHKRRDKPPYKAILTYCHENRLDVRKVLFDDVAPVIAYPAPKPIKDGKVWSSLFVHATFV